MGKSSGRGTMRCRWLIAVGLLAPALTVEAAAPAAAVPLRLNLEQCLARALKDSPNLAESAWDVRLAQSRVAEAAAGRYPTVNVTSISGVAPSVRGQVHEPPVDTVDSNTGDLGPFTRVELEFVQPLFTWGKIAAGHTAAVRGLEQEVAKQSENRQGVILEVKRLYYDVLLARQVSRLLDDVAENFRSAVKIAAKRLEADSGTVTQADVLKLKVGLSSIEKERHRTRGGAELAREALARAIGVALDADFDIADTSLDPVPAKLGSLEQYIDGVFGRSPQWKQLLAGLAAREAEVQVSESDYYPALFLAGGFRYGYAPGRERQLSPFAKDDFNFLDLPGATLGIRWPLSFFQTRARVQAAKAELAKLRVQKRAAATGIRLAVKKAYLHAVESRDALAAAEKGRKAARGLLVTSVSGFELGVGEAKNVFEALGVYTQVTSSFYEAVREYNVAVGELSQAVGEEVADLDY